MSRWREKTLRAFMVALSLAAAAFVALPPPGVCLRELLAGEECCLPQAELSAPVRACCAAHSCSAEPERDVSAEDESPLTAPLDPQGDLCLVSSTAPYLAPSSTADVDAGVLVPVHFLPFLQPASLLAAPEDGARLFEVDFSGQTRSPALRRGSSVLRI